MKREKEGSQRAGEEINNLCSAFTEKDQIQNIINHTGIAGANMAISHDINYGLWQTGKLQHFTPTAPM